MMRYNKYTITWYYLCLYGWLILILRYVKGNRGEIWPSSIPTIRSGRTQSGLSISGDRSERDIQDAALSVHQEWYFGAFKSDDRSICERRVFIPDISCSHASPLVIVHKKEGGIRMAVDYREVNQFLRVSANQLPYQDMLFQQLGGQLYYRQ